MRVESEVTAALQVPARQVEDSGLLALGRLGLELKACGFREALRRLRGLEFFVSCGGLQA